MYSANSEWGHISPLKYIYIIKKTSCKRLPSEVCRNGGPYEIGSATTQSLLSHWGVKSLVWDSRGENQELSWDLGKAFQNIVICDVLEAKRLIHRRISSLILLDILHCSVSVHWFHVDSVIIVHEGLVSLTLIRLLAAFLSAAEGSAEEGAVRT